MKAVPVSCEQPLDLEHFLKGNILLRYKIFEIDNQPICLAKALGLKNIQQDKLSLVRAVAQSLLDHGIVKVMVDLANASRDDIKKMKPF